MPLSRRTAHYDYPAYGKSTEPLKNSSARRSIASKPSSNPRATGRRSGKPSLPPADLISRVLLQPMSSPPAR